MKLRKSLLIIIGCSCIFNLNAQMTISGRHIVTHSGENVVFRGVNEMFCYGSNNTAKMGTLVYPEIEKTGANAVRIMWTNTVSVALMQACLYNCVTKGKAIPIIAMNDSKGDITQMANCVNFWVQPTVVSVIQGYKKWVIINIANEAGDASVTDQVFKDTYKNAITQMRNAGYTVPLMIDATDWAKNFDQLKRCWSEILNHDPLKRVIFSAHAYWINYSPTFINNMINTIKTDNMPFVMGEGPQQVGWNCRTTIDYKFIMRRFQEEGIGWLAWSWGMLQNGDCSASNSYDITTNGIYGSWDSQWGRDVVFEDPNSIKNTSVRPTDMGDFILPIEMSFFKANTEGVNVRLHWATATEKNNKGFDIERSTDGLTFEKTGFMKGAGTSVERKDYHFLDLNTEGYQMLYYRLKQIDEDGTFDYSSVQSIQLKVSKNKVVISPNPTKGVITLTGFTQQSEVKVFDINGRLVLVKQMQDNETLDLSQNTEGVYFLFVNDGLGIKTAKIVLTK